MFKREGASKASLARSWGVDVSDKTQLPLGVGVQPRRTGVMIATDLSSYRFATRSFHP